MVERAEPSILFLGTGTAFHPDGRGSQALFVRPGAGAPFLVDLGPSAVAAMTRFDAAYAEVERLFLTHLHGDHVAGWPFLVLNLAFVAGRSRPLHVHGPVGTRRCLEGLMDLCYRDVVAGGKIGFDVVYHELAVEPAEGLDGGETTFDVLPMDHHPTSLAYRFRVDGRTLAVTGDTRWCDALEPLARAADLLVIECTTVREAGHAHLSLDRLRAEIGRLTAARIVLVHLDDEVAASLGSDPLARVTAAYDGMVLDLGG